MSDTESQGCDKFAELLGVYALDALEPDEAAAVENHLQSCPRCSQEVDDHRQTIALLAAAGGPAPERAWERIAESISADTGLAASPPPPRLIPMPTGRQRGRGAPTGRGRRSAWVAGVAAAAAVAVVVGLQTARVDQLNHRVDQLSAAARQTGGFQGLAAALVDPGAHHYTLASTEPGQSPLGQLIVLPSGASYLVGSRLPQLSADSTYQLWSLVDGRAVSVGLLGDHPNVVAFTVDPSVSTVEFLVTVEPAGGVVAPTSAPVARATV